MTVNAAAFGGSGDYSYAVYYKKAASNTWTTVKSYGKTATASVKPAAVGSYDVCVKVKDTNGTIAKQYFKDLREKFTAQASEIIDQLNTL